MIQCPSWLKGDVSRETLAKLDLYQSLLSKWTGKINLIAKSTIDDIAQRHIWDSAQAYQGETGKWVDLGAGGGLPGIVVAIMAGGQKRGLNVVLVESDQRKATFLRTCARELDIEISVIAKRIDEIGSLSADIVSARALAHLNDLLPHAERHLTPTGTAIFMKGERWQAELADARQNWRFSCDATPSKTNSNAAILRIRDIERA